MTNNSDDIHVFSLFVRETNGATSNQTCLSPICSAQCFPPLPTNRGLACLRKSFSENMKTYFLRSALTQTPAPTSSHGAVPMVSSGTKCYYIYSDTRPVPRALNILPLCENSYSVWFFLVLFFGPPKYPKRHCWRIL